MAYLTGFGLENFRVFEKNQWFDFAPITVFTGTNNSGKSSVSKGLLLLKDALQIKPTPFGELTVNNEAAHNLGAIEYFINNKKSDISFSTGFQFHNNVKENSDQWKMKVTYANPFKKEAEISVFKELVIFQISEKVPLAKISVEQPDESENEWISVNYFFDFEKIISKYYNKKLELIEDYYDDHELIEIFSNYHPGRLLFNMPGFYDRLLKRTVKGDEVEVFRKLELKLLSEVINVGTTRDENLFSEYLGCLGQDSDSDWTDEYYYVGYSALFTALVAELNLDLKEAQNVFEEYATFDVDITKNYRNFIRDIYDGIIVKNIRDAVSNLQNISIIPYNRIQTDRLIFNLNGSSLNFDSLNRRRGGYKKENEYIEIGGEAGFISKWAGEFELGIKFKDIEGIAYNLQVKVGDEYRNLADVGIGINQVITIILAVSIMPDIVFRKKDGYSVLILEEPEAGLHPALQSKLADLVVDAQKTYGTQFIIETHSEYFIRRLQYLTASKTLTPDDTCLYYFYPPDKIPNGEKQVKKISISEDGHLSADFGPGFFDESTRLVEDMWKARSLN
jgi:predicted ATPase